MVKTLVAYDTKYGNTQRVAELIGDGLKEAGVEVSVENMKEVNFDTVAGYEAILMGSPNHIRRPTRTFKKFVGKLRKLKLRNKTLVAFDTYVGQKNENEVIQPGGDQYQVAMLKMEDHLRDKLPDLKLLVPGLSIAVAGMEGPIVDAEIPKCKEFGKKIASQL
ncbi:MAG: flavodoxin family protein [Candidatus Thorarchaeota archaeon]